MTLISRSELYDLVWQKPMMHVATDFGISGNGLSKICRKLDIPYPARGYWAKLEAGKLTAISELPKCQVNIPESIHIKATPQKPVQSAIVQEATKKARKRAANMKIPQTLRHLHPAVKSWVDEHKHEQLKRVRERRNKPNDPWSWAPDLLLDLTERDSYRFRVTSALLKAVEKTGGTIVEALITGKLKFRIDGEEVQCTVIEKMTRPLMPSQGKDAQWTAYPRHHQTGLHSSGYLRIEITTYLPRLQKNRWIETEKHAAVNILPEIIGAIIGAGPYLVEARKQRAECERRDQREALERYERQRLQRVEEQKWNAFRSMASNWEECQTLKNFTVELQRQVSSVGDTTVDDRRLSEWIVWANKRIAQLDPLSDGVANLFQVIAQS